MASLKLQVLKKMDTLKLYGVFKAENSLIESNRVYGINNYNACCTFKKHALDFASWERQLHPQNIFKNLETMPKQHIIEWLLKGKRDGENIHITKFKVIAMSKLIGCNSKTFGVDFISKNGYIPKISKSNSPQKYKMNKKIIEQSTYLSLIKNENRAISSYKLTTCPYCGSSIKYVDSSIIYGNTNKVGSEHSYMCSNFPKCDAYVGVYKGTNIPLGRLSNAPLRRFKQEAHVYFDYLWKSKEVASAARSNGYKWLSEQLNISPRSTHIGWFNDDDCKKVIETCKPYYWNLRNKSTNCVTRI